MARRPASEQLSAWHICSDMGEPDPYKARQLIQAAERYHKQRKFHEATTLMRAADLMLHKWITLQTHRATDTVSELKRWGLPVAEIALERSQVASSPAAPYSHIAGAATASPVAPSTCMQGDGQPGKLTECACGHAAHFHRQFTGDCGVRGCICQDFDLPL